MSVGERRSRASVLRNFGVRLGSYVLVVVITLVNVWPEPRSKTDSTSNPFFSKIFASLAIHGIHKLGDKVETPQ